MEDEEDHRNSGYALFSITTDEFTWQPALRPHVYLAGSTGQQRATTSRIAAEAEAAGWAVIRGGSLDEQLQNITEVSDLMGHRFNQLTADRASSETLDPVVLIVDSYEAVRQAARTQQAQSTSLDQLNDLVALASPTRIHLIVCGTSPLTPALHGAMRIDLGPTPATSRPW